MVAAIGLSPEGQLSRFGLSRFRAGQREVIEAVFAGRHCLCIMPTGGGKSLCYQLPAVAREGLTLVVSPLIALMKDQVDALAALGIAATFINSSLAPAEAFGRMNEMAAGRYDLVYIAPERLRSSLFLEKLRETKVQLLAVDEAHCISEWGHDFRPDYARLGRLRQRLGNPQTIALTATATPDVRRDIVAQLELEQPQVFITGFARPNLRFEVEQAYSEPDRDRLLIEFLRQTPGAGIVYSATRKNCEALVPLIAGASDRKVALYHAGLEQDARRRVQEEFMSGRTPIIVATNAFGMGIDKANLRFVVHYNIPGTLEAYYQEAGRAGRDGEASRCLLLYAHRDRRIQEFFIDSAYPDPAIVEQVYDFLREIDQDPIELTLEEIREQLHLPIRSEGVSACEKLLEGSGALERLDARQNMAGVRIDSDLPTLVDLLPKEAKVQRRVLQAIEQAVGGLRFERVYVNPRRVAEAAGIEQAALTRALRELSKLRDFDFVPPFRGRAVHMLEREKPFAELGIDFAEQERRKAAEYAKLDRMVGYALGGDCRQLAILEYFGDENQQRCGRCDSCERSGTVQKGRQGEGETRGQGVKETRDKEKGGKEKSKLERAEKDSGRGDDSSPARPAGDIMEAVRMVLSGVARMKGRYGKQMVAKMLIGSRAKDVLKFKFDKLSTFGILAGLTEPLTLRFIDALLAVRLLQQVEEQPYRPLLRLTESGEDVMRGVGELPRGLALEPELVAKLRAIQPKKNGEVVAKSAVRAPEKPKVAERVIEKPREQVMEAAKKPRAEWFWTWRVMSAGISAEECCEIRRIDRATLKAHLAQAEERGEAVEMGWLLTEEERLALEGE